jgi:predicted lipid-binding transport protein (Tim44 family)
MTEPIGPVTKYAILGVAFGVVTLPLFGVLSGQFGLVAGLAGGFMGGLVGGAVWGLGTRLAAAR